MRASLPVLSVLAACAAGCAASTPLPAELPRVVEVAPVHEEPPPPPPKPPPPPTLEELAHRMAADLDATTEKPAIESRGSFSSVFGSSSSREEDDVIVQLKVVSTTGKFIKDALSFSLSVHDRLAVSCLMEAKGGERKGTVTVNLAFDREGTPLEPVLKSTTFKEKNVTECIREGFRNINPVLHSDQDPIVQANNRATVEISVERPQGF